MHMMKRRLTAVISTLLGGAVLVLSSPQAARADDCKTLIDRALDTPIKPGQELAFHVNAVHLASRNGGSFTSFALEPGTDLSQGRDRFFLTPVSDAAGLYHRGEFKQTFPQRLSNPDRTVLEVRRGGRLAIRSITWGFVIELSNLTCDREASGRITVRSLNVFPGYGHDSYNFILFPVVSGPIN
jgi:hypothetical protein